MLTEWNEWQENYMESFDLLSSADSSQNHVADQHEECAGEDRQGE